MEGGWSKYGKKSVTCYLNCPYGNNFDLMQQSTGLPDEKFVKLYIVCSK